VEIKWQQIDFEDIRPYKDLEVRAAIERIIQAPEFYAVMNWVHPELSNDEIRQIALNVKNTYDFQKYFMHVGIRKIVERTSDGLTCEGFERINNQQPHLYVANHRDIFLDSGILQILLFEREINTTQITFGSNLMQGILVDIGKVNKMFKVERGVTRKQLYESSLKLSSYIRHVVANKRESVWIAQRNGRTKDGIDLTQTGVLKMFSQSGEKDFVQNFNELNLTPLVISYEYEPCDFLKTQELYVLQTQGSYTKQKNEDLNSILRGILDYKGRIHLAVAESISLEELNQIDAAEDTFNKKIDLLTKVIDKRVYQNYKLWPTHYIAADLLNNDNQYSSHYSTEDKLKFEKHLEQKLALLVGEYHILRDIFLKIYANPVFMIK
jgi:hypothetical protein